MDQAASADFSSSADWMTRASFSPTRCRSRGLASIAASGRNSRQLVLQADQGPGRALRHHRTDLSGRRRQYPEITKTNNACKTEIKFAAPKKAAICNDNSKNSKAKCDAGVAVPVGVQDFLRSALKRANAYVMPNIDHRPFEDNGGARISETLPHHRQGGWSRQAFSSARHSRPQGAGRGMRRHHAALQWFSRRTVPSDSKWQ